MTDESDDYEATRTCTWSSRCWRPATHPLWRQTRPGLVVHERVCDHHLPATRRWGYRDDAPPFPPPRDTSRRDGR